jgi:plasmid maintenance system killer protein
VVQKCCKNRENLGTPIGQKLSKKKGDKNVCIGFSIWVNFGLRKIMKSCKEIIKKFKKK